MQYRASNSLARRIEKVESNIVRSLPGYITPMRRAATLEKTWRMSNRNGKPRSIISSNTRRRMSLALLALIWIEPFLALTLTTLQHFRQLKTQKLYMHVDGRPKKVRTVSRGEPCLMYETRLSRMIMQLPPAQMANRDGDAGMETMLWDINIIPNELDNGYLMLPPGVLHMSALGRFGRFTLFSPRVSHSKHFFFFSLVSRTRHHSCAGHCFTIGSHCNFFRNATIPPGRIKQQKKTKQTATKQNQQRNTNQTQTENQTPEWKLSSLFLYNVQLK